MVGSDGRGPVCKRGDPLVNNEVRIIVYDIDEQLHTMTGR